MIPKAFLLCCAAYVLLLGGCAGDEDAAQDAGEPVGSPAPQVKTYTNKTFAFSLEYPADWQRQDLGMNPAGLDVDFATIFSTTSVRSSAAQTGGKDRTAAIVSAVRLSEPLGKSGFRRLLREAKEEVATKPGGWVGAPGYSDIEVARSEFIELAGVPCLVVDQTYRDAEGTGQHRRYLMFGKGDVLYTLFFAATAARWPQDQTELEAIAQSFVIL
jgi:hypothetical protein